MWRNFFFFRFVNGCFQPQKVPYAVRVRVTCFLEGPMVENVLFKKNGFKFQYIF